MARNRLGHTTRNSDVARAIAATPLPPPMLVWVKPDVTRDAATGIIYIAADHYEAAVASPKMLTV